MIAKDITIDSNIWFVDFSGVYIVNILELHVYSFSNIVKLQILLDKLN
jgi:hypothetical protein